MGNFGFSPSDLGSLNGTQEADLLFLGELHVLQEITKAVSLDHLELTYV